MAVLVGFDSGALEFHQWQFFLGVAIVGGLCRFYGFICLVDECVELGFQTENAKSQITIKIIKSLGSM